ncbi:hypothetical protein FRB99_008398 [Tulasnella sp. 403]|nr:hypothetical protein FRB99_008398 [Tulasnella sp. 403]
MALPSRPNAGKGNTARKARRRVLPAPLGLSALRTQPTSLSFVLLDSTKMCRGRELRPANFALRGLTIGLTVHIHAAHAALELSTTNHHKHIATRAMNIPILKFTTRPSDTPGGSTNPPPGSAYCLPTTSGAPSNPTAINRKGKRANCGRGYKRCPLFSGMGGYDCVDVRNDPESCGGCVAPEGVTLRGATGKDCTAIPNVSVAACVSSKCVISE